MLAFDLENREAVETIRAVELWAAGGRQGVLTAHHTDGELSPRQKGLHQSWLPVSLQNPGHPVAQFALVLNHRAQVNPHTGAFARRFDK
jgi:hypothetical protein